MAVNNPRTLAKLLRAIAGSTQAKAASHDVIYLAAAELLEQYADQNDRMHLSNKSEA